MGTQSVAELERIQVGGEIRIRARYFVNVRQPGNPVTRISDDFLYGRPIGPRGTDSSYKWDSKGKDWTRYEESLLLNFKADFTGGITAFVELYEYHVWSEQFRSDYFTGADSRTTGTGTVQLNQGYVELNQLLGKPICLRVGKQGIRLGKGWLVSNMSTITQYVSFDALRLFYANNGLTVDAFAAKLGENTFTEDSDVDFFGVHGMYGRVAALNLSAYWLFLRDGSEIERQETTQVGKWLNTQRGYKYSSTRLHTVGFRLHGESGGFDYDMEVAYQFSAASHLGALFKPVGSNFGDTDAKYRNWAGDVSVGYTFQNTPWQPKVYLQGVYFEGQDNRDITFADWLNPLYRPTASVSFNRLFSEKNYLPVLNDSSTLSNFQQIRLAIEANPAERLLLHAHVSYNRIDKPFDPPKSVKIGRGRIPIAPVLSFWTDSGSRDLGWEVAAWANYRYSDSLLFSLYGSYLWTGRGLTDGAFIHLFGTEFSGGSAGNNAAYLQWMMTLNF